ncbi:hypothetical protein [Foetidibacter luteolus]|uniref:hypothetical protein n=1 Tax=Foetidibacter luteolus TaxID=2608880 RepID=UPI00129B2957|nr:hypothetical protein [Foetidibacter luteolus]
MTLLIDIAIKLLVLIAFVFGVVIIVKIGNRKDPAHTQLIYLIDTAAIATILALIAVILYVYRTMKPQ